MKPDVEYDNGLMSAELSDNTDVDHSRSPCPPQDRDSLYAAGVEKRWARPFFCCDAVLDTYSRQIVLYSGYAKEM